MQGCRGSKREPSVVQEQRADPALLPPFSSLLASPPLTRPPARSDMPSNKSFRTKVVLSKAAKQNRSVPPPPSPPPLVAAQPADSRPSLHSPIPQWFRLKSDTKIQYNGACLSPSRRDPRAARRSRRAVVVPDPSYRLGTASDALLSPWTTAKRRHWRRTKLNRNHAPPLKCVKPG